MFQMLTRTTLMLLASGVGLLAAGNSIGMAVTNGGFQVDHARVMGNATLFDGSSVETAKSPSQLQMDNGASMRLATDARATVYQRKVILERGTGQMESAAGYEVEALVTHFAGHKGYGDTDQRRKRPRCISSRGPRVCASELNRLAGCGQHRGGQ